METAIDNDFSTRSGVFTAVSGKIRMRLDQYGQYEYVIDGSLTPAEASLVHALDGLKQADECEIASELYNTDASVQHDEVLGYYRSLFCGSVSEGDYREKGTSGGIATWVLVQLLRRKLVDGVITVVEHPGAEVLFTYEVLNTEEQIRASAKSRYYPMEMSSVLRTIRERPGKYVIVGIPSFISDVRRLQRIDSVFRERIAFTISLLCGQQKTTKYGEAIGFEVDYMPGTIERIDFRYKSPQGVSSGYLTEMVANLDGVERRIVRKGSDTYVSDWGAGMFKVNFSDYVDDCFGETADISIGDAWLPQYVQDSRGTNVLVVRNKVIEALLEEAAQAERVHLDRVEVATVKASQTALIRHYRTELPYRLSKVEGREIRKRVSANPKLPFLRRQIQELRIRIAPMSKIYYLGAVEKGDWEYFVRNMAPVVRKYRLLTRVNRLYSLGLVGIAKRAWGRL